VVQWTVYHRPGCSLCEEMLSELADVLGPDVAERVQVVDISGDEQLERKYATRIPVLVADGDFVCAYRLDRDRVNHYLI
jgi:glutaredoxin-like protein DUF836